MRWVCCRVIDGWPSWFIFSYWWCLPDSFILGEVEQGYWSEGVCLGELLNDMGRFHGRLWSWSVLVIYEIKPSVWTILFNQNANKFRISLYYGFKLISVFLNMSTLIVSVNCVAGCRIRIDSMWSMDAWVKWCICLHHCVCAEYKWHITGGCCCINGDVRCRVVPNCHPRYIRCSLEK